MLQQCTQLYTGAELTQSDVPILVVFCVVRIYLHISQTCLRRLITYNMLASVPKG